MLLTMPLSPFSRNFLKRIRFGREGLEYLNWSLVLTITTDRGGMEQGEDEEEEDELNVLDTIGWYLCSETSTCLVHDGKDNTEEEEE